MRSDAYVSFFRRGSQLRGLADTLFQLHLAGIVTLFVSTFFFEVSLAWSCVTIPAPVL